MLPAVGQADHTGLAHRVTHLRLHRAGEVLLDVFLLLLQLMPLCSDTTAPPQVLDATMTTIDLVVERWVRRDDAGALVLSNRTSTGKGLKPS